MTAPRARWTPKRTPTVTVWSQRQQQQQLQQRLHRRPRRAQVAAGSSQGDSKIRRYDIKRIGDLIVFPWSFNLSCKMSKNLYDTFTSERLNLQAATTTRSCGELLFSSRLYDVFSSGRLSLQAATTTRSCGAIYFAKQSIRYLFIRALKSIEKQQQRGVAGRINLP